MKRIINTVSPTLFASYLHTTSSTTAATATGTNTIDVGGEGVAVYGETINTMVSTLHTLLQLKYQSSWLSTLDVIRCLFECIHQFTSGKETQSVRPIKLSVKVIILTLSELYESIELGTLPMVDTERGVLVGQILGATVIKACGVRYFLEVVPVYPSSLLHAYDVEEAVGIIESGASKEWVISLLQGYLKAIPCLLSDYLEYFIPIARKLNSLLNLATSTGTTTDSIKLHAKLRTRIIQIWGLFPIFCGFGPPTTDLNLTFPTLTKVLEGAYNDTTYPEIQHSIVLGLTYIVNSVIHRYNLSAIHTKHTTGTTLTLPTDHALLQQYAKVYMHMIKVYFVHVYAVYDVYKIIIYSVYNVYVYCMSPYSHYIILYLSLFTISYTILVEYIYSLYV